MSQPRYMSAVDAAPYDWRIDSQRCYTLWCAAKREMGIREGTIEPLTEAERAWAAQGPVPVQQIQAGRT